MRLKFISAVALIFAGVVAASYAFFSLAGSEGTATDPLITKSYIDEVFEPQIQTLIQNATSEAAAAEEDNLNAIYQKYKKELNNIVSEYNVATGAALNNDAYTALLEKAINDKLLSVEVSVSTETDIFHTVTVPSGKTLVVSEGTELFLRNGTAAFESEFLNVPGGTVIASGGTLKLNTLYLSLSNDAAIKPSKNSTFLIRGSYAIQ